MEMLFILSIGLVLLLATKLLFLASGCGSSAPTIVVGANCPAESIGITFSVTSSGAPGNYRDTARVTVTCLGAPIRAVVEITWPGGSKTTGTTNPTTGQAVITSRLFAGAQSGATVTATIQGTNGAATATATIP